MTVNTRGPDLDAGEDRLPEGVTLTAENFKEEEEELRGRR